MTTVPSPSPLWLGGVCLPRPPGPDRLPIVTIRTWARGAQYEVILDGTVFLEGTDGPALLAQFPAQAGALRRAGYEVREEHCLAPLARE